MAQTGTQRGKRIGRGLLSHPTWHNRGCGKDEGVWQDEGWGEGVAWMRIEERGEERSNDLGMVVTYKITAFIPVYKSMTLSH